jgi:hypothetical protein
MVNGGDSTGEETEIVLGVKRIKVCYSSMYGDSTKKNSK